MVTKSRQLAVCKIQKFGNIKVTAAARCAETACRAGGAVTCWGAVLCRSPAFFVLRDILSQRWGDGQQQKNVLYLKTSIPKIKAKG